MSEQTALESPTKKRKVFKTIISILLWVILGLFLLFTLLSVIDRNTGYNLPIFGFRSSVILTTSMAVDKDGTNQNYEFKQIQQNDVIVTYQTSYEDIKVGDIITYNSNIGLICHRVVEKYQSENYKYFVTKGDANDLSDAPIEASLYKGKVVAIIPSVGVVVNFLQSYYFLMAIGFSGAIIFGLIFLFDVLDKKKDSEGENNPKE